MLRFLGRSQVELAGLPMSPAVEHLQSIVFFKVGTQLGSSMSNSRISTQGKPMVGDISEIRTLKELEEIKFGGLLWLQNCLVPWPGLQNRVLTRS